VFIWHTHAASFVARNTIPHNEPGSLVDLLHPFTDEERATGGRVIPINGSVFSVPGVPDMYDWEMQPTFMPMAAKYQEMAHFFAR
jgi:hypothetical protein